MIITINNKTHGSHEVLIDYETYIYYGLDKIKINIEYNKSKHGFYAYIIKQGRKIRLHRYITECPEGLVVDHLNGNTLDNRNENLRVCTRLENNRNRLDSKLFAPTKSNKLGVRGLCKLYCRRDNRSFYRYKLKGYKTKYFSLDRYQEAIEYSKNPTRELAVMDGDLIGETETDVNIR